MLWIALPKINLNHLKSFGANIHCNLFSYFLCQDQILFVTQRTCLGVFVHKWFFLKLRVLNVLKKNLCFVRRYILFSNSNFFVRVYRVYFKITRINSVVAYV